MSQAGARFCFNVAASVLAGADIASAFQRAVDGLATDDAALLHARMFSSATLPTPVGAFVPTAAAATSVAGSSSAAAVERSPLSPLPPLPPALPTRAATLARTPLPPPSSVPAAAAPPPPSSRVCGPDGCELVLPPAAVWESEPAAAPVLFGRDALLRDCLAQLRSRRVVVLYGERGAGTTAAAAALASEVCLRSLYAGGVAWVSVGGPSARTLALSPCSPSADAALAASSSQPALLTSASLPFSLSQSFGLSQQPEDMSQTITAELKPGVDCDVQPPRGGEPVRRWSDKCPTAAGADELACLVAMQLGIAAHGVFRLETLCHSLRQRKALIVLDGVEPNSAGVIDFIRHVRGLTSNVAIVVTSAYEIDLEASMLDVGAARVDVGPLPPQSAAALVEYLVRRALVDTAPCTIVRFTRSDCGSLVDTTPCTIVLSHALTVVRWWTLPPVLSFVSHALIVARWWTLPPVLSFFHT